VPDPLDARLTALGERPDMTVPPGAAVRARGDRRRRRARAAYAGASVLVVAGLVGGVALAGGPSPRPDELTPAPFATAPAAPTTSPTADQSAPAVAPIPRDALLDARTVQRLRPGRWQEFASEPAVFPGLTPCSEGGSPAPQGLLRSVEKGSHVEDGAGEADLVVSQVLRFAGAREASDELRRLVDEVQRCPTYAETFQEGGEPSTATADHAFVDAPGADEDTAYVHVSARSCTTCATTLSYWVLTRADEMLALVRLDARRTADRELAAWAAAARERMRCATGRCASTAGAEGTPEPSGEPDEPDEPDEHRAQELVTVTGVGPVLVGMTLDEAAAAWGQELVQEGPVLGDGAQSCRHVRPASGLPDVLLMLVDDVVARVDVPEGSPVRTERFVGVGSTEAEVRAAYEGRVEQEPHPYTDGHSLRHVPDDQRYTIVFETDGERVTSFRSGYAEQVSWIEGCA
jgi:hypothetical protein